MRVKGGSALPQNGSSSENESDEESPANAGTVQVIQHDNEQSGARSAVAIGNALHAGAEISSSCQMRGINGPLTPSSSATNCSIL